MLVPTITLFKSASASLDQTIGVNDFFFFFAGCTIAGVAGTSFWKRIALSCLFLSSAGVNSILPIVEVVFFVPIFALKKTYKCIALPNEKDQGKTHFLWNNSTELGFFVVIHALNIYLICRLDFARWNNRLTLVNLYYSNQSRPSCQYFLLV